METEKSDIESKVNAVLSKVRPFLQEDGGDVEFFRYDEIAKVVEVRLTGNCKKCPLSIMTLRAGIERFIIKEIPEVKRIEQVQ